MNALTLRHELARATEAQQTTALRWHHLKTEANEQASRLDLLQRRDEPAAAAAAAADLKQAEAHLAAAEDDLLKTTQLLEDLIAEWHRQVGVESSFEMLDPRLPIALFPVRLEVHFQDAAGGGRSLQIRVYPDESQVETHEPALTPDEAETLDAYRQAVADLPPEQRKRSPVWHSLVDRFGAPRAAWIVGTIATLDGSKTETPVQPLLREDVWTRTPEARTLPDRWRFSGFHQGKEVFRQDGNPIPDPLPAGPIPEGHSPTQPPLLEAETGIPSWVTRFEDAERLGMAARVELAKGVEVDFVMVMGIKAALTASDSALRLSELLDAHRHTEGLTFLRQGTPTNNSRRQPSGYRDGEDDGEATYELAFGAPGSRVDDEGDESNGALTARALGLDTPDLARPLARADNAGLLEQPNAAAMNRALWPATLRYYLIQMASHTEDSAPRWDEYARPGEAHFCEHVRGRGPLPLLRIGRQPLALLPVTALGLWRPYGLELPAAGQHPDAFVRRARPILRELRQGFLQLADQVPRIDPEHPEALLSILSTQAISPAVAARQVNGPGYEQALADFFASASPEDLEAVDGKSTRIHEWLPGLENAHLNQLVFADEAYLLDASKRICEAPLSEELDGSACHGDACDGDTCHSKTCHGDACDGDTCYICWLVDADPADILQETNPPAGADTLLYLLLRHALLWEYGYALYRTLVPDLDGSEPVAGGSLAILDPEIFNRIRLIQDPASDRTIVDHLFEEPDPATWLRLREYWPGKEEYPSGTTPADILYDFSRQILTEGPRPLLAMSAPRGRKSGEPTTSEPAAHLTELYRSLQSLQEIPTAELDRLLGETLDLCSHRLDAWITSVATQRLKRLRQDEPHGIQLGGYGWLELPDASLQRPESRGYLHAPSLDQATLAAVLEADPQPDGQTRRSLASGPLREAVRLAEEVSQGLAFGDALGYRLERDLHERQLDHFIHPLRSLPPLEETAAPEVSETPVRPVVDGDALLTLWSQGEIPWGREDLDPKQDEAASLRQAFECLERLRASLANLLLAESVYHAVKGNTGRLNATLESAREGRLNPDFSCIRTPRTGTGLVHRLLVAIPGDPGSPTSPRARAEPRLNAWLKQILPPLGQVTVRVTGAGWVRLDDLALPVVEGPHTALQAPLDLEPLDALALARAGASSEGTELERRILLAVRRRYPELAAAGALSIAFDRNAGWPPWSITFFEWLAVARIVADLIAGARPLEPADLDLPVDPVGGHVDGEELASRAQSAVDRLQSWWAALPEVVDAAGALDLLLEAAVFLDRDCLPEIRLDREPEEGELLRQLEEVRRRLGERWREIERIERLGAGVPGEARIDHDLARLRAVFGRELAILPVLGVNNGEELSQAFANQHLLPQDDPELAMRWLGQAGRVRDGAARLHDAMLLSETLQPGGDGGLTVGQIPVRETERWVALELPEGAEPHAANRVSLVGHLGHGFDPRHPFAGLLIDEWVETLPSPRETTGLAFHLPSPPNEAPRCLLLAVAPDPAQSWTAETLETVLLESFDLARIRAVGPEHLEDYGRYLPALFFAHSAFQTPRVVTTDFLRNAEKPEET